MNISLEPGKYVVAVSGGVDSMALLHALLQSPGLKLTVAHYDHGIRPDSWADMLLVQKTAKNYGLPFVFAGGQLGTEASEALARQKRYEFLHTVRKSADAKAIVTAHHKDDVLETAIINLLRGTGRKGLASLKSTDIVKRPLLHATKRDILQYAVEHKLDWHEDSTNADTAYLRNHVRHKILPRFEPEHTHAFHGLVQDTASVNLEIDILVKEYLTRYSYQNRLKRQEFILLPHAVAREVMAAWLRKNNITTFDKKMLERCTHAAKILTVGRSIPIDRKTKLKINGEFLALEANER